MLFGVESGNASSENNDLSNLSGLLRETLDHACCLRGTLETIMTWLEPNLNKVEGR